MMMAVESMEMAPGAIPRPGRVREQRFLSPKSPQRWWWRCGTFHGFLIGFLGFSNRKHLIGEEATRGGARGAHTTPGRGLVWPAPELHKYGLFWSIRTRIEPNFRSRIINIKFSTLLQKTYFPFDVVFEGKTDDLLKLVGGQISGKSQFQIGRAHV